jgi:hypothetical protein
MAKTNRDTQAPTNGNTEAGALPDRFKKIETERYMFNVQKCWGDLPPTDRKALVGYLINIIPMPPIQRGKEMKDWEALLIKTTEATNVLDREKNVIEVPAGTEVLIPATAKLLERLTKAASHPKAVFEIFIAPKSKIDIGKGQTMWTYDIGASATPILRSSMGMSALLEHEAPKLPQLPENATASDDDIPF